MAKQLIGGDKRVDTVSADPSPLGIKVGVHRIPPGYRAQWMTTNEATERRYPDEWEHPLTGERFEVRGWQPAQRDMGIEAVGGTAADGSAGLDTTIRKGPHVLMIIPEKDYLALESRQEQNADVMERAFAQGTLDQQDVPIGSEHRMRIKLKKGAPAHPSRFEPETLED